MNNFNLTAIIEQYSLDPKELAAELFPENKHPMPALARVINGEALLNTDQISKLSFMTGIPIDKLFTGEKWVSKGSKSGSVILENADYRAEMDTSSWVTKVYHKNSLFHEAVLVDGRSVTLSEYIKELDKLILNHNK